MDTVTYPNESVQAYLNEHFVLAKFNTAQPDAVKEVTRQFRTQWTPTFVFLDHHGIEVRRTVGYLPPEEFLPELEMARANALLLNGKYGEAYTLFRHVAEEHGGTNVAPEALYYAGVAGYRRDGTHVQLKAQWQILKEQHPDSTWWTRASFIDG